MPPLTDRLRRLLFPLAGALASAALLYLGGTAYRSIGIAALDTTRQALGYALGVGEILFLAILVQRIIRYIVLDGMVAQALGSPVPGLLAQISAILVYGLAFAAIIGIVFDQDLTVLWAASGVAGVVLGMAARELILDLFTGLAVNLDRPIRLGDFIQLHRSGDSVIEGKVIEISWRTTRIADLFRNVVVVPNSRLSQATITNYSMPENYLRVPLTVTLPHEAPVERVLRVLEAAAIEGGAGFVVPGAPGPAVSVKDISPIGTEYVVDIFPSLETRVRCRSAVLAQIARHLALAGIRPARVSADPGPGSGDQPSRDVVAALLAGVAMLRCLNDDERRQVATDGHLRRVGAGSVLAQAGEIVEAMTLVVEGLVTIDPPRAGARGSREDGPSLAGPGVLIGGPAALTGEAHPRTVRTRTAVLVLEIDRTLVGRLLETRPGLTRDLAHQAALAEALGSGALATAIDDLAGDILTSLRRQYADITIE